MPNYHRELFKKYFIYFSIFLRFFIAVTDVFFEMQSQKNFSLNCTSSFFRNLTFSCPSLTAVAKIFFFGVGSNPNYILNLCIGYLTFPHTKFAQVCYKFSNIPEFGDAVGSSNSTVKRCIFLLTPVSVKDCKAC